MSATEKGGKKRGLTRRQFIAGATAAAGSLAISGCDEATQKIISSGGALPDPGTSGIDHIVVVMMENRSFDHFLGWVPGADGIQAGVSQLDLDGNAVQSYDLAPEFQNCALADPDHTYPGGRTQINGGKMDGFLLTQPTGDRFPVGYYTADSLPFYKGCAENWTICDHYFSGMLGLTTPNRIYMHAGQTDRLVNSVDISTLPTVWDRMLEKGRSVAYYYTDVSYISYWGSKYSSFSKKYDMSSFATSVAGGDLPDLMFVDNVGNLLNEGGAISIDDHPYADIRNGQAFLNHVYNTLRAHPQWDKTLLIINYDEWGGFYDHVPPPLAPVSPEEAALGNDGSLGCRVPCVLIGPRVRRGHVEKTQFDPNSILNMIAWRFGFEPLGARASSNNLALALDFSSPPDATTPAFEVAQGPFGQTCIPTAGIGDLVGVPLPGLPVQPIPRLPIQFLPIPGLDVPFPSLLPSAGVASAEQRRASHEDELEALRQLGRRYGF
ncbi:MAG: alkaline phosphatase family protein [Pseudomonadota bacterium]